MARIKFGADGWFARAEKSFNEKNVVRFADAAGRFWSHTFPGASAYVAFDTRAGADEYARLIAWVLSAYGLRVRVSDRPVPTPALTWAVRGDLTSCGGVMVTGGHRSSNWLGIKLRDDNGCPDNGSLSGRIMSNVGWQPTQKRGDFDEADLLGPYLEAIASFVDEDAIRELSPPVIFDSLYGSAQSNGALFLGRLGADVTEIHGTPDPSLGRLSPNPVEPWTEECQAACKRHGSWAGFIFDCDADRLGASDENGRYISPNLLMPLVMEQLVFGHELTGRVVTSSSTSDLVRRQAKRLGCRFTIVPTGYQWIWSEMERGDVLMGGEESGAIGVPIHMLDRDPMLVAALICEMMAQRKKSLAELVRSLENSLGHVEYGRRDIALDIVSHGWLCTVLPGLSPNLVLGEKPAVVNHAEGLRVSMANGSWLLIRPSGNDRIIRVYAEAPTLEERDALLSFGEELVLSNRGPLSLGR